MTERPHDYIDRIDQILAALFILMGLAAIGLIWAVIIFDYPFRFCGAAP